MAVGQQRSCCVTRRVTKLPGYATCSTTERQTTERQTTEPERLVGHRLRLIERVDAGHRLDDLAGNLLRGQPDVTEHLTTLALWEESLRDRLHLHRRRDAGLAQRHRHCRTRATLPTGV